MIDGIRSSGVDELYISVELHGSVLYSTIGEEPRVSTSYPTFRKTRSEAAGQAARHVSLLTAQTGDTIQ